MQIATCLVICTERGTGRVKKVPWDICDGNTEDQLENDLLRRERERTERKP